MDFTNSGVVYEEVLTDILLVLEEGWPAGPTFLYSLGTLIEATAIHETVYYDPLNYTSRTDLGPNNITSLIRSSPFVRQLTNEGALKPFPQHDKVDTFLRGAGHDFEMIQFLANATWRSASFASAEPGREENTFKILLDLLELPGIFVRQDLVQVLPNGRTAVLSHEASEALSSLGFNLHDITLIEAFNRRALAFLDLARNLDLNVYPTLPAVPHHLGSVQASNSKARELFETVKAKLLALDESVVGEADFRRLPIPPLAQVVLANANDSPKAIATEICELRRRQATFRQYLTDYERRWRVAESRGDRQKLHIEFLNAWATFTKRMEKPTTRIIYTLWDILKSPTEILKALGDKLAREGRELSIIGRVRGLHDFWQELAASPVPERNTQLLSRLFPRQVDERVWRAAGATAARANQVMSIWSPRKPLEPTAG